MNFNEDEKQRVLKWIRENKPAKFHPSTIAMVLDMDYFCVGEIIIILEKEGLIEELKKEAEQRE